MLEPGEIKEAPAVGEWSRVSTFSIKLKKYIIKEQECGCLMKDGRLVEVLTAGKYSYLNMLGYEVQIVPMTGEARTCQTSEEVLMKDEKFVSRVVKAALPDERIALRFANKVYREMIAKPETLYWNVSEKNEFRFIDITRPHMEDILWSCGNTWDGTGWMSSWYSIDIRERRPPGPSSISIGMQMVEASGL